MSAVCEIWNAHESSSSVMRLSIFAERYAPMRFASSTWVFDILRSARAEESSSIALKNSRSSRIFTLK